MDPKEKKVKEEELNVEETQNGADEQPQNEQAEEAAPLTHEEELEKELEKAQATLAGISDFIHKSKRNWKRLRRLLMNRRTNICACPPSSTIIVNAP